MDDSTLTQTVATMLNDAGAGIWRPDGPAYAAAEIGIHYGAIPVSPDQGIGLTIYNTDDDVVVGTKTRWLQARTRGLKGRSDGADALSATVFAALQGVTHRAGIALMHRVSSLPLGADENGRQERSDNYRILLS